MNLVESKTKGPLTLPQNMRVFEVFEFNEAEHDSERTTFQVIKRNDLSEF